MDTLNKDNYKEDRDGFIITHEKFIELRNIQKQIALSRHLDNINKRNYYTKRREFYHSKGINVPEYPSEASYVNDGFNDTICTTTTLQYSSWTPRYFNVLYGILKGREYLQIEPKVRDDNALEGYLLAFICRQFGLSEEESLKVNAKVFELKVTN